jgi:G3E family GTPase
MTASEQETKTMTAGNPAVNPDSKAFAQALEAHQALSGMLFAALKMRGRQRRLDAGRVPLTIIGGFLGSGKTTVLSKLLTSPHGRRLVVLVNDFGAINIDAELVEAQSDDMINLKNGCACCAVSSDLTNALIEVVEREDLPDAIVLEASGIADPHGIAQTALSNPGVQLDGCLTVVDAETLDRHADDPVTGRLFRNQIAAADIVLLSKVDLVDEATRKADRAWLANQYPDKRIVEASHGNVPPDILLGIETERDIDATPPEAEEHAHDFESVSVSIDAPLDDRRLQDFFGALPETVLRGKGFLNLARSPDRRTVFQRVGHRWLMNEGEPWGALTPVTRLVFIGPRGTLDRAELTDGLRACEAGQGSSAPTAPDQNNGDVRCQSGRF